MKILFYKKSHDALNKKYIELLNSIDEIDEILVQETVVLSRCNFNLKKNLSSDIIRALDFTLSAFKIVAKVKKYNIKMVILSVFDYRQVNILDNFLPKEVKIFAFHHHDLDRDIEKDLSKYILLAYKRCTHLVLEEFIINGIRMIDRDAKIIVIPLPLPDNYKRNETKASSYVSISEENDLEKVTAFLSNEELVSSFENVELYVKFPDDNIVSASNIHVITGYLPYEEYNRLISENKHFIRFFSDDFKYRSSGTLIDALANGKIFLCNETMLTRQYSNYYPTLVRLFSNERDLLNLIKKNEMVESNSEEYYDFINRHSDEAIIKSFRLILQTN